MRKKGTPVGGGWVLERDYPEPLDATFSYWRNQRWDEVAPVDWDALRAAMREIYNRCTEGGNPPPAGFIL